MVYAPLDQGVREEGLDRPLGPLPCLQAADVGEGGVDALGLQELEAVDDVEGDGLVVERAEHRAPSRSPQP